MSRKLFFGVLIVAFLMLTGCKSDSQSAKESAMAFMVSMENRDRVAIDNAITQKAKEQPLTKAFLDSVCEDKKPPEHKEITYGEVTIQNDTATVVIENPKDSSKDSNGNIETASVLLRREEKVWKAYAITGTHEGSAITLDFENPERVIGDILQAAGKDLGKASTALLKGVEGFVKGLNEGLKENK
jgi:hypothetical protein